MKLHPFHLVFVSGLLLAFAAIAAACRGDSDHDGGLTLEEYFKQVEEVLADIEARFAANDEQFRDALATASTGEEKTHATGRMLRAQARIGRDGLRELDDIDPPTVAKDAHEEYHAAFGEFWRFFENFVDTVADLEIQSRSELQELSYELLLTPDYKAASDRLSRACFELQSIARVNGINVVLEC